MDGWIKIHRKLMDNPLYFSEPFTRAQAWIDLLLLANHKENFFFVRGNKVVVKRGQVGRSQESLASRWQWSRGKVIRFLYELESSDMIVQQKNKVMTLISICNYQEYQSCDTTERTSDDTTDRRQTEQQTDINKNDKKDKNENNDKKIGKETGKRFTPPTINEVQLYISEKGYSVDAERFVDFYESKGWMIGKNKMKDWKAALRTWSKGDNKKRGSNKSLTANVNDIWG